MYKFKLNSDVLYFSEIIIRIYLEELKLYSILSTNNPLLIDLRILDLHAEYTINQLSNNTMFVPMNLSKPFIIKRCLIENNNITFVQSVLHR